MTYNGYTLYVDMKYDGGIFDLDNKGNLSKVLKLFGTNSKGLDTIRFERFDYSNTDLEKYYQKATKKDLVKYGCSYFNENGERPFKSKFCETCKFYKTCFMRDEDLERYRRNKDEDD